MISNFLKYDILNEIVIREIERKDINQVIQLIKVVYKEAYDEKYYHNDYLKRYANKIEKSQLIFWKGVFLKEKLIAQMLFIIKNGFGKLKLTMVDPEFESMGVMSYLGFQMEKVLQLPEVKDSNLQIVYAYVENNNLPMIKILEEYQFNIFGRTPNYNINSFYKIYGRVINIKTWKYITPHFNISRFIQNINIKYNLKRLLSIFIPIILFSFAKQDIKIEQVKKKKKTILFIVERRTYAKIHENNQSWYSFKFINNPSIELKVSILAILIEKFEKNEKILSISLFINMNDYHSQHFLLEKGFKFFAYLPCYHECDNILMGKKKR